MNKFFTKFAANTAVKRAGIVAIGCLGLGLFAVPSAHGQFDTAAIMAFLTTMNTTMQSAMAVPLQIMQQVNSDMSTFTKTALYPLQQIQAAQSMATQGLQQSENMQGMINDQTIGTPASPQAVAIAAALAILVFASFLIGWGWGGAIAGRGVVWGACAILLIYSLGVATEAGAMRVKYSSELWINGPSLPQVSLLVDSINQLSDTHVGV